MPSFNHSLFVLAFLGCGFCSLITNNLYAQKNAIPSEIFAFQQIKTDTLFQSNQIISLLKISKNSGGAYYFDLAHHSTHLKRTSEFGEQEKAIAAINGGFFNMDKGGSVTYLEENDSVYQKNIPHGIKWAIADWAKTGAVIIRKDGQLQLEAAKPQAYYENSKIEESVLITGPLLLEEGKKVPQRPTKFTNNRHPRTCLCETPTTVLLLTVDGRQAQAQGMSLLELQEFLLTQNCSTAINLDGGGSTTMWLQEKGIVNHPSDLFGERKVANAFLVKQRN